MRRFWHTWFLGWVNGQFLGAGRAFISSAGREPVQNVLTITARRTPAPLRFDLDQPAFDVGPLISRLQRLPCFGLDHLDVTLELRRDRWRDLDEVSLERVTLKL
jgi:hypothetical protein